MSRLERRKYWQQIILDWQSSGSSIAAFCRDLDINPTSFYQWRKKLHTPETPRFFPVVLTPPSTGVAIRFQQGIEIEVTDQSSPIALQLAIEALR
jgi:transposase-like protein